MSTIHINAAFDMRDPAQRAALGAALAKTPVEQAQDRLFAAGHRVDRFVAENLTISQAMSFCLAYEVPASLEVSKAARLTVLVAAQRAALAGVVAAKALTASIETADRMATRSMDVDAQAAKWAAE